MAAQTAPSGYRPPMGPPSHMMYNQQKMPGPPGSGPPPGPPGPPQGPPVQGQPQQQPMPPYGGQPPPNFGHYGPRPPYGPPPPGSYPGPYGRPNNIPPGYPGYPGPQQYSGSWNSSPVPQQQQQQQQGPPQPGVMPGKGAPPPTGAPGAPMPQRHPGAPPTTQGPGQYPPKQQQHPQMMKGYPPQGGAPPQTNSYSGPPMYNGPPMNSGAPLYNGPNMPPPHNSGPGMGMPPHQSGGYPGPYPNSHPMNSYGPPNSMLPGSGSMSPATSSTPTGPDGIPLHDETSQQSTLSQSSDRSDGRQTPKTGPNNYSSGPPAVSGYPPSSSVPPGSPHSSAPSPGGSLGSSAGHDSGYPRDISSPGWPRPPPSPMSAPNQMYNNSSNNNPALGGSGISPGAASPSAAQGNFPPIMPPSEPTVAKVAKTSKNSEMLMRLFDMDENPDRRRFLDQLLSFMEDRGTPIIQCPTISKNPLDLYKLYVYAKERGGYLECTKNKTWKDIAAQLGIGASSSGAYTLKKHYGKNLLPFECHFDRGGMDPGPILAQVEGQTKKAKAAKLASMPQPPPAPSPGSQDSRDSYSNSSDPYGAYPPPAGHNSYPPPPPVPASGAPTPPASVNNGAERPPSHPGKESIRLGNPFDDPVPSTGSTGSAYPQPSNYGPPPPGGYMPPGYSQAGAAGPRPPWPPSQGYIPGGPPLQGGPPPLTTQGDMYGRPGWPPQPPYPGGPGIPPTSAASGPPVSQAQSYGGQPPYPDQYQGYGSNGSPAGGAPSPYGGQPGSKPSSSVPPTSQSSQSAPPPPNAYPYQRPPMYPGGQPQWQNRYPPPGYGPSSAAPSTSGDRSWAASAPPSSVGPRPAGTWSSDRTSYYGPTGPGPWNGPAGMMAANNRMRMPYRPDMRGPQSACPPRPGYPGGRYRELPFPPGCVESTPPFLVKRRKYTKGDVQPVDGWKLVMALRSGLLMESTWALDVINILLYDDNGVTYFGLGNMPGLLEALLDHWRAVLIEMFGITEDLELNTEQEGEKRCRKRLRELECAKVNDDDPSEPPVDLGQVSDIDPNEKITLLKSSGSENFTKRPRFSEKDVEEDEETADRLFVIDSDRSWDVHNAGFECGMSHWLNGGGKNTQHIVTHLKAGVRQVTFTRHIKDSPTAKPKVEASESKNVVKLEIERTTDVTLNGDAPVDEEPEEDIVDKIQRLTGIQLCDPEAARQRWKRANLEEENYVRDEPSLQLITEAHDNLGKRAVCLSTILRNLSFVPGNEFELSKSPMLMTILGKLLLLQHWYPARAPKQRNYDRGEEEENLESCSSLTGDDEWWWDYLHVIRENIMVVLANISGALDLEPLEEDISRPILDGLLEWAVSSSAYAQDPFPNVGPGSSISPQRCAIEALCKLCLKESNIDLILSTPPFSRLEKLIKLLTKKLYRYEDQVLREFSINLLYYLSAADSGVSRLIAVAENTVSLLLSFIEQAEANAMVIAQQHGVNALRDNPESMGTSLDMLRRAATTLNHLSRHKDNIPLLVRQEQRLLALVMSQILDQGVAAILSQVLFNIEAATVSKPLPPMLPPTPPPAELALLAAAAATTTKQQPEKTESDETTTSEAAPTTTTTTET